MDRMTIERVRRVYETESYDDGVPAILALAHPDIELVTVAPWLDQPSYHGHDGVEAYFTALDRVFGELDYDLIDLRSYGDALVAEVLIVGGDPPTRSVIFQALSFENGLLRRVQGFLDRDAAIAAAEAA